MKFILPLLCWGISTWFFHGETFFLLTISFITPQKSILWSTTLVITHSPHLISNVLFVYFGLWSSIHINVVLLGKMFVYFKNIWDTYIHEADVTKFVFALSFMLSIDRNNNFLRRNMVGSENGSFWYKQLFMPWIYRSLPHHRPAIPKHKIHIGTSHFTAGYLKVLNPPISLPLEMTPRSINVYIIYMAYIKLTVFTGKSMNQISSSFNVIHNKFLCNIERDLLLNHIIK